MKYMKVRYIKEFWEWSKSSYGQDKSNVDAQTTMSQLNTQNGYSDEGQWVKTQDGDVYIEEITDGRYKGYDRKGDLKTGNIKDIIRILMKGEVLNENVTYDYGCVMLYFDPNSTIFNKAQELISNEDVYNNDEQEYGRENEPHITILYGLHNDIEDNEVEDIVKSFNQPEIILDTISIFEDDGKKGYDVVKFDIDNKDITEMNKKISKLPYTSDYPDYQPHVTISYIKSGSGKKYIKKLKNPLKMKPIKIVYSKADGSKKEYEFNS